MVQVRDVICQAVLTAGSGLARPAKARVAYPSILFGHVMLHIKRRDRRGDLHIVRKQASHAADYQPDPRESDAADGSTPTAAPCCEHQSTPLARWPRAPSVGAHL